MVTDLLLRYLFLYGPIYILVLDWVWFLAANHVCTWCRLKYTVLTGKGKGKWLYSGFIQVIFLRLHWKKLTEILPFSELEDRNLWLIWTAQKFYTSSNFPRDNSPVIDIATIHFGTWLKENRGKWISCFGIGYKTTLFWMFTTDKTLDVQGKVNRVCDMKEWEEETNI